jgi:hypothetical protein
VKHFVSLVALLTVMSAMLGAQTFGPAHTVPSHEYAPQVASVDLNHDGYADLLVLQPNSQGIGVKMNLKNKTFGSETIYLAGSGPAGFGVADFNGDGKLDIAVALGSGKVAVLHGNGNGTFQSPVLFSVNGAPNSIAVGDFNNDGKKDIATLSAVTGKISILTNTGTGFTLSSFTAPTYFPTQYPGTKDYVWHLAAGDINADGATDLAYVDDCGTDQCGPVVLEDYYVLLKTSTGWNSKIVGSGSGTRSLHVQDVDNDGRGDVVAAYYGCYHEPCTGIQVLYSNANGSFTSVSAVSGYGDGGDTFDTVVADFNNDGILDIAAPVSGGNDPVNFNPINPGFAVYTGKPGGRSFNNGKYFGVSTNDAPNTIDAGFFTLSGDKDVVMNNGYTISSLSDFFNLTSRSADPCPYPTAIGVKFCSPANGASTTTTVRFRASAHAATQPANRIELWVDGHKQFQTFNDLLDHTLTLTVGTHTVSAIEVDAAGGIIKSPITIHVH